MLTAGSFVVDASDPNGVGAFHLEGTQRFRLNGVGSASPGLAFGWGCRSCAPGDLISIGGVLNNVAAPAEGLVNGVIVRFGVNDNNFGMFFLTPPAIVPPLSTSAVLSAPLEI